MSTIWVVYIILLYIEHVFFAKFKKKKNFSPTCIVI